MAERLFYSVGEVARTIGVTEATLRYWETQFDSLKPRKTTTGIRQYSPKDIDELKAIHYLLKTRGLSIADARTALKQQRRGIDAKMDLIRRLTALRDELLALQKELGQ